MSISAARSTGIALGPRAVAAETVADADPLAFSIARTLLVAALVGAPWALGAVVTWAWMALALVAALALFLWAAGSAQQGAIDLVWSPLYAPLALLLLLGLVQYAFRRTLDTWEARHALVLLATDAIFFFVAIQLFARAGGEACRTFGLTVLLLAGSIGLFAILQFASGAREIYGRFATTGNLFGPYTNSDHYAGLMEMLIPVAVLYLPERRRGRSTALLALLLLALAIAIASLLLSGSRGGLVALSAELLTAGAFAVWGARSIDGKRLATGVALAVAAALLLFSWVDSGWVAQRLASVVHVEKSLGWVEGGRKSLALDSLRMWRDHPVLGVGMGNFETAYPRYQSFPSDLWIDHAHNDYLEAAAETGLAGAVLILATLALFFRQAFSDLDRRLRTRGGWIRFGAALGCCGILVHSLFDYNLHVPANAAWFAVLAGMATVTAANAGQARPPNPLRRHDHAE